MHQLDYPVRRTGQQLLLGQPENQPARALLGVCAPRGRGTTNKSHTLTPTFERVAAWPAADRHLYFEGVDLLHIRHGPDPAVALVLRLQPVHQQALALFGPSYEEFYESTN